MNVLEKLRPSADHLTAERSHHMLREVMTLPTPRRRTHRVRLASLVVVGAVAAGGTAYAAGAVPGFVTERFQQIRDGEQGWPDPVSNERLVVDIELSDGSRARVWHADTEDGLCVVRDRTGTTRPEGLGVTCGRWGAGQETDPRRGVLWQTAAGGPAVAYGDLDGVVDDVSTVVVQGAGWSRSVRTDHRTFAIEVPSEGDGDRIRFLYLDERGAQVASQTTTVMIESE